MSWFDELQPASYRGIPFGVLTGEGEFGRRNALHEYPFRDKPWVEDLGRGTRRIGVTGFIVADDLITGEADVISVRDRLIAAAETEGSGALVHPTLGQLTVSLAAPLTIREHWDKGRYFELGFSFFEAGERTFPSSDGASGAVDTATDAADVAVGDDFLSAISGPLTLGAAILTRVTDVVSGWADTAEGLIVDATNLFNMAASLPGDFGRYFGGRLIGFAGRSLVAPSGSATLASLVYLAALARASVHEAADTLRATPPDEPDAITVTARAVVAAMLAAAANPADAVRLFAVLARQATVLVSTGSAIGLALGEAEAATNNFLRRTALVALVRATVAYQPWSRDDALTLRDIVAGALAAEMTIAGDEAEDLTYRAFRVLRTAVIADLNARGAGLAAMRKFTFDAPLPSLALAQRLYRDPARADEIVFESDPIHPAFVPTSFTALAQ